MVCINNNLSRDTTKNVLQCNSVVLKHANLTQGYFSYFIGIFIEMTICDVILCYNKMTICDAMVKSYEHKKALQHSFSCRVKKIHSVRIKSDCLRAPNQ